MVEYEQYYKDARTVNVKDTVETITEGVLDIEALSEDIKLPMASALGELWDSGFDLGRLSMYNELKKEGLL